MCKLRINSKPTFYIVNELSIAKNFHFPGLTDMQQLFMFACYSVATLINNLLVYFKVIYKLI